MNRHKSSSKWTAVTWVRSWKILCLGLMTNLNAILIWHFNLNLFSFLFSQIFLKEKQEGALVWVKFQIDHNLTCRLLQALISIKNVIVFDKHDYQSAQMTTFDWPLSKIFLMVKNLITFNTWSIYKMIIALSNHSKEA